VLDREGLVVTSAITNIDLHDISRSALSFGLSDFFVVHPVEAQRTLAERIRTHWVEGSGGKRIPDRKPALSILRTVESLQQAASALGPDVELWTTSARRVTEQPTTLAEGRRLLAEDGPPVLLVFGTGWGLAPEVHFQAVRHLQPVTPQRSGGYNHLSVRAAAAIIFDRLLG
jgi:hypothetical protein